MPLKHNGIQPGLIAAAVGVVLIALLVWFLWPSGESDSGGATTAPPTPTVDAEAQQKLMAALPAGYPADTRTPADTPKAQWPW